MPDGRGRRATHDRRARHAALVAVVLVYVVIGAIGAGRTAAVGTELSSAFVESGCSAVTTRIVRPDELRLCASSVVTTTIRVGCPQTPVNVAFMIGLSMTPPGRPVQREYLQAAARAIDLPSNPHVLVGVVYVDDDDAETVLSLTNNDSAFRATLDPPNDMSGAQGIEQGFARAFGLLDRAPTKGAREAVVWVGAKPGVIEPRNFEIDEFTRGAGRARGRGLMVIGCSWVRQCRTGWGWDALASPGYYMDGPRAGAFGALFGSIVHGESDDALAVNRLHVTDTLPDGLDLVPGSAAPRGRTKDGRRLKWDFAASRTLPISDTITITYRVQPTTLGRVDFSGGEVVFTDTTRATGMVPLPSAPLTVTGECELPTITPMPSATTAASPTATPPPTATAMRVPAPLYLPIALYELPCVEQRKAAVALVIDTSSSMLEPAGAGRTKLEVAITAAGAFVDELHFPDDQAAVIGFDSDVEAHELTNDPAVLQAQLAHLTTGTGTEIALGVQAAHHELMSPRRAVDRFPAMVLLTDGRANAGPEPGIAAAARAKADGIALFTIGLGTDVDRNQLMAMASRPEWYREAAAAEDLAEIYRTIAIALPCPPSTYWGGR